MKIGKIALWATPVLVVALAAAVFFYFKGRTQTVELSDGTKLTLLGVTYGKRHVSPVPKGAPKTLRPQRMNTPGDTLVVWMREQRKGNNWPNFELLAYILPTPRAWEVGHALTAMAGMAITLSASVSMRFRVAAER